MNNIKVAIRRINAGISKLDGRNKVISLVSQDNVLAQQTLIVNMGLMYGYANERVLIIDTDFRSSNIVDTFKIKNRIGLSDFLSDGEVPTRAIVNRIEGKSLDVIGSGNVPLEETDYLLGDPRFTLLINQLVSSYDRIIINTTTFNEIDSYDSLTEVTDGVVIVATTKGTTKKKVHAMLKKLKSDNTPVLGYIAVDKD